MKKSHIYLVLAVFLLVLSSFALAEIEESEIPCVDDEECVVACDSLFEGELECSCDFDEDLEEGICIELGEGDGEGTGEDDEEESSIDSEVIQGLQGEVAALQEESVSVALQTQTLDQQVSSLRRDVDVLKREQSKIKSLETKVNKVSTGQAGLQDNLENIESTIHGLRFQKKPS